jgi:hypothetical protein
MMRFPILALAAAGGWFVGFLLGFTPAQVLLADPGRQSAKFLAIFFTMPPPPRIDTGGEFAGLVLVLGCFLALGFVFLRLDPSAPAWRRGLRFGLIAWVLGIPWFELYLPWNVLHEPTELVLLEGLCWWVVLTCSGLAVAYAERLMNTMRPRTLAQ